MKIALFSPLAVWTYHFEVDIEIALKQLKQNNEVHFIQCGKQLLTCVANPNHENITCQLCKSRSDQALDLIGVPKNQRHVLSGLPDRQPQYPKFENIDQLLEYEIEGRPYGRAVASTLISILREKKPDITAHQDFIEASLSTNEHVYREVRRMLQQISPEVLYVFNGRFDILQAAVFAAKSLGIKVIYHERLMYSAYHLSEVLGFHDLEHFRKDIERTTRLMESDPKGEEIGRSWFEEKRRGVDQGSYVFVKEGAKEQLPEGFDSSKRNFVIFNNCEDEYIVFEEWGEGPFEDQADGIRFLAENAPKDAHLYLRVHPRLASDSNSQTRAIETINYPNLTVIPATSPISSYLLIDHCEKVFSFGSTVGIECVYWGKPSVLLSGARYVSLDCFYRPPDKSSLAKILHQVLPVKNPTEVIKWGYWCKRAGQPFQYLVPRNPRKHPSGATYLGRPIQGKLFDRLSIRGAELVQKLQKKLVKKGA